MATNMREFFTRFTQAIDANDFQTLEAMFHPDFVADTPQSGERVHGFAAFRAQLELYPGGEDISFVSPNAQLVDEERWVITPAFTVVPLADKSEFTVLMKLQYPDGRWWHNILLVEMRDDRLYRVESFFAPQLEAPLMDKVGTGVPV